MKGKDILLVDDDNQCLLTTLRILVNLGYTVVQAQDSLEALEIFLAQPGKFGLLITDLLMPGMNGDRLAALVHEARTDIPIIICSGSEEDLHLVKKQGLEMWRYLLKPFSKAQLLEAIVSLGVRQN